MGRTPVPLGAGTTAEEVARMPARVVDVRLSETVIRALERYAAAEQRTRGAQMAWVLTQYVLQRERKEHERQQRQVEAEVATLAK